MLCILTYVCAYIYIYIYHICVHANTQGPQIYLTNLLKLKHSGIYAPQL
jgi:hypothetical protein